MKEKKVIVGIDVSKLTLDICVLVDGEIESLVIENGKTPIGRFFTKLGKKHNGASIRVAMENTGLYNWNLYSAVEQSGIDVYVINALHLKKSMGLVRGKNDRVDAVRIATFLQLNQQDMSPSLLPDKSMRKLKLLVTHRKRLIKTRTSLRVSAKELSMFKDPELSKSVQASTKKVVTQIEKEILAVEKTINELINSCQEMDHKFKLVTSVPGVGKVLGWELLIKTDLFRAISDPRKLACYAGVVPFEFSSGTSVLRKPRVSVYADRALKKLLHMAALRVIQLDGDLQKYYLRKVAEGKNKMSVINALRNKIVARVSSAINNNRMYQQNLVMS